jgi:hypothetical protein
MRYADDSDNEYVDGTAKYAGGIVIASVLILVFIRWTFEKGN